MEATYGSVTVTLTNGLLMCAGEVLSTLVVSALFKTQLLGAQLEEEGSPLLGIYYDLTTSLNGDSYGPLPSVIWSTAPFDTFSSPI
ncbi:hypothetical protein DKX38_011516 [Salix brachista]|uniref:Uncharacterized protein n=1 Tax=Salix brachista TaxID=2182728 RepID=A0A5N5LZ91_9ROSI|nr:hypothetical protein DKX38_011516 [Salix brachista]